MHVNLTKSTFQAFFFFFKLRSQSKSLTLSWLHFKVESLWGNTFDDFPKYVLILGGASDLFPLWVAAWQPQHSSF